MNVIDVDRNTFYKEVLEESHQRPVVVDFWAEWCGPCRVLGPVLERLAEEAGGAWRLAKVDTEANRELASHYDIRGIPAVKAFVGGEMVSEFVGALPEPQIRAWLRELVPSEADKRVAAGQKQQAAGELAAAWALFEEALELDPRHIGARLGLAGVALEKGRLADARTHLDALDEVDREKAGRRFARLDLKLRAAESGDADDLEARLAKNPDDHAARLALADQAAAEERWEQAFEAWMQVIREGEAEQKDAARKALLTGFESANDPALTGPWRKKLAMELYS